MIETTNNNNKNKRRLLLILILILSVALTGTLIGTIAKYVTTDTVSDDAVSAKFGLNIPNSIDLFSDSYTNVKADEQGKKIIAPGTSGEYVFKVTGTSEVAYKVSAEITLTYSDEWDGYAPLEFSIDGNTWTDFDQFKSDLSTELASDTIAPNAEYSSTQTIHWKWPFSVSGESDAKDTAMGVISAGNDTSPEVTIEIKITAAQVE